MNNKFKWSSIFFVVIILVSYTHCDLMLTPQNSKVKNKTKKNVNSSTSPAPELNTRHEDYANAFSYYEEVVKPKLDSESCLLCHSQNGGAPLSITDYDQLKEMLMSAQNYESSLLHSKMTGATSHGGGVKCASSTSGICENFASWYALEFSQNNTQPPVPLPPVNTSGVSGNIDIVSSLGKVNGWAGNSFSPNDQLTVEFYIDGPKGSGTLIGSTVANLPGGSISGSHGFMFFIPSVYRDGNPHQFYAYAIDSGQNEVRLGGAPMTIFTYKPSIQGYDFYQANVKPILDNRCSSCHAINYDQHFNSLIAPTLAGGASATNNEMINMPSGTHSGRAHPGGNLCGSKNASPCLEIQQWWNIEFN